MQGKGGRWPSFGAFMSSAESGLPWSPSGMVIPSRVERSHGISAWNGLADRDRGQTERGASALARLALLGDVLTAGRTPSELLIELVHGPGIAGRQILGPGSLLLALGRRLHAVAVDDRPSGGRFGRACLVGRLRAGGAFLRRGLGAERSGGTAEDQRRDRRARQQPGSSHGPSMGMSLGSNMGRAWRGLSLA